MNIVAIVGYSLILIFSLYKFKDTVANPTDLVANILLIVGLSSLIAYHGRVMRTKKDENSDKTLKALRLVAHSTISTFLVITITNFSTSKFQYYDVFALLGHVSLFFLVLSNKTQAFGLCMLALYFICGIFQKIGLTGMELLQLAGRILMSIFFVNAFIQAY